MTCAGVALWANLHAGAFIAPVLLACAAGGARLDRDRGGAAGRLALAALATAGALFATPLGFGLLRYLQLHLVLPALHPVDEFRSPSWLSDPALFVYVAAFLAAVRPRLAPLPVDRGCCRCCASRCSRLRSVRFSADFALAAAPLLAVGAERGRRSPPGPLAAPRFGSPVPSVRRGRLAGRDGRGPARRRSRGGIGLDTRELPLSAIAFVDAERPARSHVQRLRDRLVPAVRPAAAIRVTACSSTRGCRRIPPSSTACWAAPT